MSCWCDNENFSLTNQCANCLKDSDVLMSERERKAYCPIHTTHFVGRIIPPYIHLCSKCICDGWIVRDSYVLNVITGEYCEITTRQGYIISKENIQSWN